MIMDQPSSMEPNRSKPKSGWLPSSHTHTFKFSLEEILPSSWAAAEYLRSEHPQVRKAFVIGSQGLVDELALGGVEAVGGADPAYATRVFRSEAEFLEVGRLVGWEMIYGGG